MLTLVLKKKKKFYWISFKEKSQHGAQILFERWQKRFSLKKWPSDGKLNVISANWPLLSSRLMKYVDFWPTDVVLFRYLWPKSLLCAGNRRICRQGRTCFPCVRSKRSSCRSNREARPATKRSTPVWRCRAREAPWCRDTWRRVSCDSSTLRQYLDTFSFVTDSKTK